MMGMEAKWECGFCGGGASPDGTSHICARPVTMCSETRIETVEASFAVGDGDPLARLWESLPVGGYVEVAKARDERGRVVAVAKAQRPGAGPWSGPEQPTVASDGEPLSVYAVVTLALCGLVAEEQRRGRM